MRMRTELFRQREGILRLIREEIEQTAGQNNLGGQGIRNSNGKGKSLLFGV